MRLECGGLFLNSFQGGASREAGAGAQVPLDPEQLVVFGEPVRPGQRAGLDLTAVGRNRQIGFQEYQSKK